MISQLLQDILIAQEFDWSDKQLESIDQAKLEVVIQSMLKSYGRAATGIIDVARLVASIGSRKVLSRYEFVTALAAARCLVRLPLDTGRDFRALAGDQYHHALPDIDAEPPVSPLTLSSGVPDLLHRIVRDQHGDALVLARIDGRALRLYVSDCQRLGQQLIDAATEIDRPAT